jgi:hypothetical protein
MGRKPRAIYGMNESCPTEAHILCIKENIPSINSNYTRGFSCRTCSVNGKKTTRP